MSLNTLCHISLLMTDDSPLPLGTPSWAMCLTLHTWMCTLHLVLMLWAPEGFLLDQNLCVCPVALLSSVCTVRTPWAGQQTPQHLSLAASCHPNPPFLWNMAQFKFLTNPLLLDPKGWSRALVLLHLLQVILYPECNPSACFSDTLTQHLCSELSTHRALGCSESCQYSHHLKENQENYLRQKKQISCADRINTFWVWLCLSLL